MIAFLQGTVAGIVPPAAYIEVSGVGYRVLMSQIALSKLPQVGQQVRILTYLQVSESGMALYGFLREDEKALFEQLIGVNGVGPKAALAVLSVFTPAEFGAAVASQDEKAVQKVPGVGKKMASRIILELKGAYESKGATLFEPASAPAAARGGASASATGQAQPRNKDVELALLGMGFSPAEVALALEGVPEGADEASVLRYALKRLGGR